MLKKDMINPNDRKAVMEAAAKYLWQDLTNKEQPLECPEACADYLKAQLMNEKNEVFAAIFLDSRHRPIMFERLFQGTIDGAAIYPRVVAEKALQHGASAVIVAHNHPSGISEPSAADQAITKRLREALVLLDIRLLDHFVIGTSEPVSLAERGLL